MGKDEIIDNDEVLKMAMQSGLITFSQAWGCFWVEGLGVKNGKLKAFAKLVADVATAKEREACAKVCGEYNFGQAPKMIQDAIRARGEA